jgi:hypothetical protein
VSGLIECILDICLLRVPGNNNTHCRNFNFPSWSWAGWRGEVFYLCGPLYEISAERYDSTKLLLKPLVEKFETQSMSPLRPILRLLQHERNSVIASGESEKETKGKDILSFEATTVDLVQLNISSGEYVVRGDIYLDTTGAHSRSIRIFKIMDACQKTCGYLHYFPGPFAPSRAQNHRELVALSLSEPSSPRMGRARPIARTPALFGGKSNASDTCGIPFDKLAFKQGSWCLLNIMLVEWRGSEAERVTIGKIHLDAWEKLKTRRRLIRLV